MSLLIDVAVAMSIVLLSAAGLIVAYGWFRVINMAHVDLLTVGAYLCAGLVAQGIGFGWAVLASAAVGGILMLLADLLLLRFLRRRGELHTLLGTWGIGEVLSESLRLTYGAQGRFVDPPSSSIVRVFGVDTPAYHVVLIGAATVIVMSFLVFATKTLTGIRVRAVLDNPMAAEAIGIDCQRVTATCFLAAGLLAGLGGALLAPVVPVTPVMGRAYAATSFTVVILGGHGIGPGPLVATLFLAATRTGFQSTLNPATATVATMVVSLLTIFALELRRRRSP